MIAYVLADTNTIVTSILTRTCHHVAVSIVIATLSRKPNQMSDTIFWHDRRKLVPFIVILLFICAISPFVWATAGLAILPWWVQCILAFPFFGMPATYFSNRIDENTDKYLGEK